MSERFTAQAIALLSRWYHDGEQNGKSYPVNSMWTGGRGATVRGLAACQRRGWVASEPDTKFNKRGHRHDITPAGRDALAQSPQEIAPPQDSTSE